MDIVNEDHIEAAHQWNFEMKVNCNTKYSSVINSLYSFPSVLKNIISLIYFMTWIITFRYVLVELKFRSNKIVNKKLVQSNSPPRCICSSKNNEHYCQ